ncbi:MAG: histidinol dehydrogenase [Bacteroidota bacterium]
MKIYNNPARKDWPKILARPTLESTSLEEKVSGILKDIKTFGDVAVKRFTAQFDQVELDNPRVREAEIEQAIAQVPEDLKQAIRQAKSNIEAFHLSQKESPKVVETMSGVKCWRKSVAIDKVGLYIPGGTAPLFSTILMLGVPAKIAGCQEIVLCTPPSNNGSVNPAILFTAHLVGVTKIFKIGGVQAVGAMAYGTETVPKVYKIFGPGNQYVTAAKQVVQRDGLAIDMPAGPSEVMVVADGSANPAFVAADLLSQAEHGVDSSVVLVATNESVVKDIQKELAKQLDALPRKEFAAKALDNSCTIINDNVFDVVDIINEYAPEHLILSMESAAGVANDITNAGSVFIGHYSPESVGDYASGTNHTLPTNGFAKAYSGVSLDSFCKKITFQELSKEGLQNIGKTVELMAEAEELIAHARAVSIRLAALKDA